MDANRRRRSPRPASGAKITALDALITDLTSGDESLAEAAMMELVEKGEDALPVLKDLLDAPDPDHRWWALSAAAQIEAVDADWLIAALDDESVPVQQAAALGLAGRPCPEAAAALINALRSPDSMLVTLAANALTAIGADAVPELLAFWARPEQKNTARLGAIRALAEIADLRAIPVLMEASEDDSALIAHWAEKGLENLGLDMVYMKLD